MNEIKNISGEFDIELFIDGKYEIRTMKCNYDVMEKIETKILRKPMALLLTEVVEGRWFQTDMIAVIVAGLEANKDTRLNARQIAEAIYAGPKGTSNVLAVYAEFLTYAITGGIKKTEAQKTTGEA